MRKEDTRQLELFQGQDSSPRAKSEYSGLLKKYLWAYEKIILIIIGFLITGVISFSLGVEKGKKTALLKNAANLDLAQKIEPAKPEKPAKTQTNEQISPAAIKTKAFIEEAGATADPKKYTIQVASFATKNNAQKEAANLAKKGFAAQILPKGNFLIVCVGSFYSQQDAQTQLTKLRNNYRDCYIRRL